MVMDVKRNILLAKAEVTYDTDPTPDSTNDILVAEDATIKENATPVERNIQWASLGNFPSLMGEQWSEMSFKVAVCGSGSAGTAPRIGALLKACGLGETVSGGISVTYAPISSAMGSVTLYLYKDGRLHKMTGCRGTGKLTFAAGKTLMMDFTFMGRYVAPTVVALPSSPTYEGTVKVPPVCKSTNFQYNSKSTLVIATLELDMAMKAVKRQSLSDTNAIAGFEITSRNPTVTIDPEAQFQTCYNLRGDWLTTQRALSIVATRAAGNIVTVSIPNFNITKIDYADRDGIIVEKLEGEASETTTQNDNFSIAFT